MKSRPMPVSTVVKTDDEIKAEMKAANSSKAEIEAAMDERQAVADKVATDYQTPPSRFVKEMQKQNQ